jgi:hypothetical protein
MTHGTCDVLPLELTHLEIANYVSLQKNLTAESVISNRCNRKLEARQEFSILKSLAISLIKQYQALTA